MKLIDFLFEKFMELPIWARYLTILVFGCAFYGIEHAWGERRFITNFLEATFAAALNVGSIALSIAASIPTWKYIHKATKNIAIAWLISALLFLALASALGLLITEIPGIGWRYKQMIT